MIGFVYKWTNNTDGKWYIGSHKGALDDGYIGSGKYFLRAVRKHGIENFTREILFEGDYKKDKIRSVVEAKILHEEDAANNPMSYNLTNIAGPNCINKDIRIKMSKAKIGIKRSKDVCKRISDGHKGKILSESHKAAMRGNTNAKGMVPWNKGTKGISASVPKGTKWQKTECPHCSKIGSVNTMRRWHFENCRKLA